MTLDGIHDRDTVEGFGLEWSTFDQSALDETDLRAIFDQYFGIFPWDELAPWARGIDIGCGTGRWARFVAPRAGALVCVDASEDAVAVATRNLARFTNVEVRHASAGALPFDDASFDFGYSLGVLHHTPDPSAALRDCTRVLKPGAPLLVYLYYALDNRPGWYRALWRTSDRARRRISAMPFRARYWISQATAALVYWPLARTAKAMAGFDRTRSAATNVPLAFYRDKPFYVMRNDALDRLGTRLEHRFTKDEIAALLRDAGLDDIRFSPDPPYWVALGRRATSDGWRRAN